MARRRRGELHEVLYDRVTGVSTDATVRRASSPPQRHRLSVTLPADQHQRLESVSGEVSRRAGRRVAAAAIVRAVMVAVDRARLDFGGCWSEADITAAVLARLKR